MTSLSGALSMQVSISWNGTQNDVFIIKMTKIVRLSDIKQHSLCHCPFLRVLFQNIQNKNHNPSAYKWQPHSKLTQIRYS